MNFYVHMAITGIILVVVAPAFIAALEYDHCWTKLYNAVILPLLNAVKSGERQLSPIAYKALPNSMAHEVKTFREWAIIGAVLYAFVVGFALIL